LPQLQPAIPNFAQCEGGSDGFMAFDLPSYNSQVLATGLNPADFNFSYYLTLADANSQSNPLPNNYTNTTPFTQTIFVYITNATTNCGSAVGSFVLEVQEGGVLNPISPINNDFNLAVCDYDGTNDRSKIASPPTLTNSAMTFMTWANLDDADAAQYFWTSHASGDSAIRRVVAINSTNNGRLEGFKLGNSNLQRIVANPLLGAGSQHVAVTMDATMTATGVIGYRNGAAASSYSNSLDGTTELSDGGSWAIGGRLYDTNRQLGGVLSVTQVHSVVRSADWIAEEYAQTNANATFWGTWTWNASIAVLLDEEDD
jgi:hypothetical protein